MRRLGIVIFGASVYDNHDALSNPRFAASANEFLKICTDRKIVAEASPKVLNLFDRTFSAGDITTKIAEFLSHGYDYVIIYYCGHGDVPRRADYRVFLRTSQRKLRGTLLSVPTLINDLEGILAGKKVFIVLDACFSGEVIQQLGEFMDAGAATSLIEENLFDSLPQTGTAVFAASLDVALAKKEDKLTVFTGAIVECLRGGIVQLSHQRTLSWLEVRNHIADTIRARLGPDAPNPKIWSRDDRHGDVTRMPFFTNHAHVPTTIETTLADREIEHFFWKRIPENAELSIFDDFLYRFPNGNYASVALAQIKAQIESKTAKELDRFLSDYPDSKGRKFARSRLAAIEWERIGHSSNVAELESFINNYSDWENIEDARRRLEIVRKELSDSEAVRKDASFQEIIRNLRERIIAAPNWRLIAGLITLLILASVGSSLLTNRLTSADQARLARIEQDRKELDAQGTDIDKLRSFIARCQAFSCAVEQGARKRLAEAEAGAEQVGLARIEQDRKELDAQGTDIGKLGSFIARCQASSCAVEQEARKRLAEAEADAERVRLALIEQDRKELDAQGTDIGKLGSFIARCQASSCAVEQEARKRLAEAEADAERVRLARIERDRKELDAQGTDIGKLRSFIARCQASSCAVEQEARKRLAEAEADAARITHPNLLRELRDRLYELNFGQGNLGEASEESLREAIREFERSNKLTLTGAPTYGVLRKLREASGVSPWGSIVYAELSRKWGISWNHSTRKEAVATARASCGDGKSCPTEVSFFGNECGAFAHSGSVWSIATRKSAQSARETALSECRRRGKNCAIVAAVCADGSDRYISAN
jgi:Domain of unknown function (DUF4189)/Caspase domain